MKESIKGHQLPEDGDEFSTLEEEGKLKFPKCMFCLEDFTDDNCQTKAGWRETQIAGICENCFTKLFTIGFE